MSEYKRIWLSPPHMGGKEQVYVDEAFAGNWIAPIGENINQFEKEIESFSDCGHAAALSSGTAAIHLALILLGVKRGDYVICQSLTFCASANPIMYLGAIPIFVDSEPDTWNMCPVALENAIAACMDGTVAKNHPSLMPNNEKQKPKAIIPVHLYGMPAKMEELMDVASKYNIPIVEDAAEAIGSTLNGKACGTFGQYGVYSFNGNKIITSSGGGALVSIEKENIDRAKFLATQARDDAPHYQHSVIGYNYRLSNVSAGIGRGQMEVLPERVKQRRANFEFYKNSFSHLPGISFLHEGEKVYSNYWLTCMLIDPKLTNGIDNDKIRNFLDGLNIESRPIWKPMHLQPVYDSFPYFGTDIAEKIFEFGLCLPSGSSMSEDDRNRVVDAVLSLF
ncbi:MULTISPECIES: DegT/DnrJ/EryC1/StrS family aminotransferase [Rhodonellum]|nr:MULTISPECIES: DegT/DnrJ/EryC1/StrS family aminotransferase [Rhodonellum]SDZ05884.1 dTDP-4-amino-4,6-dideoxygalactose transaminase [Rhodonellum ikkaensis]